MKKSKYYSKKVILDGVKFDSVKEARRYQELILMQRAGLISGLRRQVEFVLIPTQREPDKVGKRGGVTKGKVIEQKCAYIADFVYTENGYIVVEDVKGFRTADYKIKRKLMLFVHGIRIRET